MELLTPQVFDAVVAINIVIGALIAYRRFVRDLRRPLPDDAPAWARQRYAGESASRSSDVSQTHAPP